MRAVVITEHGGPEVLRVQERPDPPAGRGEVRIAVKAAGINFADTLARTGLYPDSPKAGEPRSVPAALRTVAKSPFSSMPWWKGLGVVSENKGVFGLNISPGGMPRQASTG